MSLHYLYTMLLHYTHRSSVTTAVDFMVRDVEDAVPYTHDLIYFPLLEKDFL